MPVHRQTHAELMRGNKVYRQQVEDLVEATILQSVGINVQDLADNWRGTERGIDMAAVARKEGVMLPEATKAAWEEMRRQSPVADVGYQEAVNRIANSTDRIWLEDVVGGDTRKTVCARAAERLCDLRTGASDTEEEPEPESTQEPELEPQAGTADEGSDEEE